MQVETRDDIFELDLKGHNIYRLKYTCNCILNNIFHVLNSKSYFLILCTRFFDQHIYSVNAFLYISDGILVFEYIPIFI